MQQAGQKVPGSSGIRIMEAGSIDCDNRTSIIVIITAYHVLYIVLSNIAVNVGVTIDLLSLQTKLLFLSS